LRIGFYHDIIIQAAYFLGSLTDLARLGYSRVKTALKEKIAEFGNVSVLRIGDIFSWVISQSTLKTLPETWGYSGGSMFILAMFMLLLGGAVGAGVVLFLWKRQRIDSLAYQVFE
uniref:ABC transporter permease n=1 Tax=Enterobius vermicularis TaxID=51028 RepID=A0A0N4VDU1_ENTVE